MTDNITTMSPKEAIATAKAYVADLFGEEDIGQVRLEELRFDDAAEEWRITVGFERPPGKATINGFMVALGEAKRDYKVVTIRDRTGGVASVTNWPSA